MAAEAAAAPDTGAAVREAAAALAGAAAPDALILAFVVADSSSAVAIGGVGGVRSAVMTELRPAATPAVPVVFESGIDMT